MDGITYTSFQLEPANGKVVRQVDLTGFSKGIYIARLKTGGQVLTEKVVVR
jgi:hypothetical protein